jgi:hypothetical protein
MCGRRLGGRDCVFYSLELHQAILGHVTPVEYYAAAKVT